MRHILLAATALAMLSGAAYAQDSTANSGSSSTATNTSGSQSSSVSNPRVNVTGNPIGNGTSSSNSGARATANTRSSSRSAAVGNSTTVNVSGYTGIEGGTGTTGTASDPVRAEQLIGYGGSYTVRNTPEVIAPSVVGGNACAVGASGGVSLPGFGLALGATWADRACERRQQAALLFNMGEQKIALELMCQDDNIRSAMKIAGKPCIADVAVAQVPAPVAEAAAPEVKVAIAAPVVMMPAAPKPEWCARAAPSTEASKAYVAQACGK